MIRADIIDPVTYVVLEQCEGADDEGYCPRLGADGHIPCAGAVVDAHAAEVAWHLRIPVPDHAKKCPLRGFSLPAE